MYIYVVQDSEFSGFLLFMKKKFDSWTIAGLFLSFYSHNFLVLKKAGTVRAAHEVPYIVYGVLCTVEWLD